jgi:hypothetical protein
METNKPKLSASFFFLCVGLLITLTTSVVSFLNLVFSTLEKRFPDVLNSTYQYGYSTYDYESIRMALATLIIFFPVFLVVSYFWSKFTKGELGAYDEVVKKWVMYIILFLSAVVTMVDLVALIRYFISGEITARFILKVLVTLLVAVLVGVYYILFMKGSFAKLNLVFGVLSSVIVLLAVSYSFMIMGSPFKQRMLRLDDRRVNDLQSVQYQVINYWQQKEKLPEKLSDLVSPLSGYSLPVDPEFEKGKNYEYELKDAKKLKFALCAEFSLPMPKGWREYGGSDAVPMPYFSEKAYVSSVYPPMGGTNESWDHETGRTCFERTIDKDMYPPFPKSVR